MGSGNSGKKGRAYTTLELKEYVRLSLENPTKANKEWNYKDKDGNNVYQKLTQAQIAAGKKARAMRCAKFKAPDPPIPGVPVHALDANRRVYYGSITSKLALEAFKDYFGPSMSHGKPRYCLASDDETHQQEAYEFLLKEIAGKPPAFVKRLTSLNVTPLPVGHKTGRTIARDKFLKHCRRLLMDGFDLAPREFVDTWNLPQFQCILRAYHGLFGKELRGMLLKGGDDPDTSLPHPGLMLKVHHHDELLQMIIRETDAMVDATNARIDRQQKRIVNNREEIAKLKTASTKESKEMEQRLLTEIKACKDVLSEMFHGGTEANQVVEKLLSKKMEAYDRSQEERIEGLITDVFEHIEARAAKLEAKSEEQQEINEAHAERNQMVQGVDKNTQQYYRPAGYVYNGVQQQLPRPQQLLWQQQFSLQQQLSLQEQQAQQQRQIFEIQQLVQVGAMRGPAVGTATDAFVDRDPDNSGRLPTLATVVQFAKLNSVSMGGAQAAEGTDRVLYKTGVQICYAILSKYFATSKVKLLRWDAVDRAANTMTPRDSWRMLNLTDFEQGIHACHEILEAYLEDISILPALSASAITRKRKHKFDPEGAKGHLQQNNLGRQQARKRKREAKLSATATTANESDDDNAVLGSAVNKSDTNGNDEDVALQQVVIDSNTDDSDTNDSGGATRQPGDGATKDDDGKARGGADSSPWGHEQLDEFLLPESQGLTEQSDESLVPDFQEATEQSDESLVPDSQEATELPNGSAAPESLKVTDLPNESFMSGSQEATELSNKSGVPDTEEGVDKNTQDKNFIIGLPKINKDLISRHLLMASKGQQEIDESQHWEGQRSSDGLDGLANLLGSLALEKDAAVNTQFQDSRMADNDTAEGASSVAITGGSDSLTDSSSGLAGKAVSELSVDQLFERAGSASISDSHRNEVLDYLKHNLTQDKECPVPPAPSTNAAKVPPKTLLGYFTTLAPAINHLIDNMAAAEPTRYDTYLTKAARAFKRVKDLFHDYQEGLLWGTLKSKRLVAEKDKTVTERSFDEVGSFSHPFKPVKFVTGDRGVPKCLIDLNQPMQDAAKELIDEKLNRLDAGTNDITKDVEKLLSLKDLVNLSDQATGYAKARILNKADAFSAPPMSAQSFFDAFPEVLPKGFKMANSSRFANISMMEFFINLWDAQADTHRDPHHGLLVVSAGGKTIRMAPPPDDANPAIKAYMDPDRDGYYNCNPHDPEELEQLGAFQWYPAVHLGPGDALFIPNGWLHAIKTEPGTVAFSIMVEPPLQ